MGSRSERLADGELHAVFDRLFPAGFAGADVGAEIASEGWERSPLAACFHPSADRLFQESVQFHRNLDSLRLMGRRRRGNAQIESVSRPEPTLEDIRRDYRPEPVHAKEELTELVGRCLWDVFSDNHEVITADGRIADIGSFRGASAFLDDYLGAGGSHRGSDYLRFYLGTVWIHARADLAPVYAMIFRRIKALGGDWVYCFPEIGLIDLRGVQPDSESCGRHSPHEALMAERTAQKREAALGRARATLNAMNMQAREAAMDDLPPATVRAYRHVYRRDPKGWPPA